MHDNLDYFRVCVLPSIKLQGKRRWLTYLTLDGSKCATVWASLRLIMWVSSTELGLDCLPSTEAIATTAHQSVQQMEDDESNQEGHAPYESSQLLLNIPRRGTCGCWAGLLRISVGPETGTHGQDRNSKTCSLWFKRRWRWTHHHIESLITSSKYWAWASRKAKVSHLIDKVTVGSQQILSYQHPCAERKGK